jgi:hypothetical protein
MRGKALRALLVEGALSPDNCCTGRLMQAIRAHLSEVGHIKDVIKDERNSGVTIVELL